MDYVEGETDNYCEWCQCEETSDDLLNCNNCYYCVEGEDSPYGASYEDVSYCAQTGYDDYYGDYWGSNCGEDATAASGTANTDMPVMCEGCDCESYPHYDYDDNSQEYYLSDDAELYCWNCDYCDNSAY